MSVHYKFKSALEYDTVTFDGLHISVKDLKNAIVQQKRIGKSTDFDLKITNAQTKEVYDDDNALIPKNTSLLIARVPTSATNKSKSWEGYGGDSTPPAKLDEGGTLAKAVDLSSLDAPEDDKIKAMMSQSTQDYDPSKFTTDYMKIRGSNQVGAVPPNYRCYKCHQTGHWIKDCPLGQGPDPIEIKKSTGIPRSFMVPVEGPQVPGAMMTPNGSYAVPVLDHQAYSQKNTSVPAPVPEKKPEIPEDLLCSICSDLLTDAVMIPCCGNSFCDECIRSSLLESEDHECPDCHDKDISPGTLIPNRFLRNSVANFRNTTGYVKKPVYKPAKIKAKPEIVPDAELIAVDKKEPAEIKKEENGQAVEKTVISEADSTEKNEAAAADSQKDAEAVKNDSVEGPPGVSPKTSPKVQPTSQIKSTTLPNSAHTGNLAAHLRSKLNESAGGRPLRPAKQSPSYAETNENTEDRPGTPTVDEPGMGNYRPSTSTTTTTTTSKYTNNTSTVTATIPTMIGMTTHQSHGPSMHAQSNFPPAGAAGGGSGGHMSGYRGPPPPHHGHGHPPNYRLPPPGAGPHYMPPGGQYPVPPRPMFDANRPPMTGPPPAYQHNYPGGNRPRGDYSNRRIRDRTPPGIIDDPLAAFNRMLREKDERERRLKQRNRRSYSRSRSRSRSYSPSPRRRSRSPRRRHSRSRSRSFSMSRSRSRSYSGSLRGSPPYRQLSPPPRRSPLPPQRKGAPPPRYRSPVRSPPRHHRPIESRRERDRDYDHSRPERSYNRDSRRDNRDDRERDRDRYFDSFDDRRRGGGGDRSGGGGMPAHQQPPPHWGQSGPPPPRNTRDMPPGYYPDMPASGSGYQNSRYPPVRDYPPGPSVGAPPYKTDLPMMAQQPPPQRRFDDIAPPGVEEPPVPGLEPSIPYRFDRPTVEENSPARVKDDEERDKRDKKRDKHEKRVSKSPERTYRNPSPKRRSRSKDKDYKDYKDREKDNKDRDKDHKDRDYKDHKDRDKDYKDRDKDRDHKDRDKDYKERDKDRVKEKDKDHESPEKHKKRKRADSSEDRDKRKDSDSEEKSHKSKEKKKKRDKKDSDKKKKKDKKEKHRKDDKEKDKEKEKEKERDKDKEQREKDKDKNTNPENIKKETDENSKSEIETESKPELTINNEPDLKTVLPDQLENANVERKLDLYDDVLSMEGIDKKIVENYLPADKDNVEESAKDEEEENILELQSDIDLKVELDKNEMLAPVPEKSKWEVEEDASSQSSPKDSRYEKTDKSGKVTTEVLKRAENAIFAKAINAIRPIEIKKISADRAKLYSGEKEENLVVEKKDNPPPARISVKDRLGIKVEDDPVPHSRKSPSLSPFSKRGESGRNYERRVEVDDRRHAHSTKRRERSKDRDRYRREVRTHDRRDERKRSDKDKRSDSKSEKRTDDHRSKSKSRLREHDKEKEKRRKSRSRSASSKDKSKKRDKKVKKEKSKDDKKDKEDKEEVAKITTEKRKTTLDESNFEPDYDLESESDKDEKSAKKDESSSDDSSSSSSDDDRKKKKHKKHRKRKKRDSSSSSSDSDSESSDDDKRRKKHKKKQKKKKKSKHK